jgi:two-component system, chemotaxis family, sensor kinase CheA
MPSDSTPTSTHSRGLSISQKLIALIASTCGLIVLLLTAYFYQQQVSASYSALNRKAATYGRLVSKQVASAVAFDDQETAREVFDSTAQDHDVESMLLLTETGATLYVHGAPGAWVSAAAGGVKEQRVLDVGDRIGVVAPVVSAEGPRGTLVIELSTRELVASNRRVLIAAAVAGVLALAFGATLAFLIARSLGRRLEQIGSVARAVTIGELDHEPVKVAGSDEIALLGHAFNAMLEHIRSLVQHIQKNAEEQQARLESQVRERTAELNLRNADMRLVLDNVDQGFAGVDLQGKLSPERSAILARWLGEPKDTDTLFSWLERSFPGKGDHFRVAWDGLAEEWMPLEMRIDQLPREIHAAGLCYTFAYKPVFEGETLSKLLVVMTDITAMVQRRRAEEEEHELAQVVRKMLEDRTGFREFMAEADELVAAMQAKGDDWKRLRYLHTLKGNASIFGFASLARLCHEIESAVHERGGNVEAEDLSMLKSSWTRLKGKVVTLTETRDDKIEVSQHDYDQLLAHVDAHAPPAQLRALLEAWVLESVEARLARLGEYAQSLAQRLDKGPIEVRLETHGVRLDPHSWTHVWQSLVHVVRNAVDHGLETREERAGKQKAEHGTLRLDTRLDAGVFKLEISDDGRGIDWEQVARVAKNRGVPHQTPEQLREALFADGLTTREQASDTSGRGVGLSAVKQTCQQTGGRIQIMSEAGHGTRFAFEWNVDGQYRPSQRPHLSSAPASSVILSEELVKQRYVKAV